MPCSLNLRPHPERTALCFSLSAGQCADGPEGRKLLSRWAAAGKPRGLKAMIMDRAYEADETRQSDSTGQPLLVDLPDTPKASE